MTTESTFRGMLVWTAIMLNLSACSGQATTTGAAGKDSNWHVEL